jgi:Carboxypeptidase regulatory-like domain
VKERRLRILGALVVAGACLSICVTTSQAQIKSASGKVAGVVNDTLGIPQLGATVELISESAGARSAVDFLTNTQGVFRGERVAPGLYSVRVTLAGFLPTLEQHVRINAHVTTVVRVQLESMFASLDQLRRAPSSATVESDDWKWVLRSASVTRPVLQWMDDDSDSSEVASNSNLDKQVLRPRARLEFTDGARRPGSASGVPSAPATAFAYDQKLGRTARLLMAGEMNYIDSAPGGGVATVWLPTGSLDSGPHSTLVLRDAKLGPDGQNFRGVRMEQGGTLGLGDRAKLIYSGEYVLVGLDKAATSLRPRLELDAKVSDSWRAALIFTEEPGGLGNVDPDERESDAALAAAVSDLDSFPTLLWRNGSPVLEGGWHEEIAAERKLGMHGELQVAAFHDDDAHVAVYGHGGDLPSADYLQDYFSNAFAYDGGSMNSWGTRVAVREKISDDLEVTAVYAFAGALSPSDFADGVLREMLKTSMHHSVGASVTKTVPRSRTKVTAGYKWISGEAISRLDSYGESIYQMDPYLHVGIRQTLPKFGPGHWQAIADCDNILAQGYVSLNSQDGRTMLVPAFRTFRGGLSVQF